MENLVIDNSFWKDRRVLVTGHTGFKGSWLSLWLQTLGAKVTGLALQPATVPNMFDELCLDADMQSTIADIRDFEKTRNIISKSQPEIVFHMAAQALVRYGYKNPIDTFSTNIMGTINVLEAVRHFQKTQAVVVITSDKCYENTEQNLGYVETDRMGGSDPYSSSKDCAELVTSAYRKSYFSPANKNCSTTQIATARAGNVIGGGDWAEDRLLPDLIRSFQTGEKVQIRFPRAIRPWQHVLDPLCGYMNLAEALCKFGPKFAEAWNFGPEESEAWPVGAVVEYVGSLLGDEVKWGIDNAIHEREAHILKLNCLKASKELGWQPRWTTKEAIEETIHWYSAFLEGESIRSFSIDQIQAYQYSS